MIEQPTVGRIVHWYESGRHVPQAAIVIYRSDFGIDLTVFNAMTGSPRHVVFAQPRVDGADFGWEYPPRA